MTNSGISNNQLSQRGSVSDGKVKIAVFRALFLGDTICTVPVFRALRQQYPKAEITLVGLPWQREIVRRYAMYFDRFIEFKGWPGIPEVPFDAVSCVEFVRDMQKEKFDIVFQMQGNGISTNAMCILWGAARTYGLRRNDDEELVQGMFPVSDDNEHEVIRFLKLLDAASVRRTGTQLEYPLSQDEEKEFSILCDKFSLAKKRYVCLHPGSKDPKRRWPAENFALIGDRLSNMGFQIVVTGSEQESEVVKKVIHSMREAAIDATDAFAPMDLGKLGALIKYAALLVSNDTGVSHIAAATETPSVIMFSPYSVLTRWAPENQMLHRIIPAQQTHDLRIVWHAVQEQIDSIYKRSHLSVPGMIQ